MSDDFDVSCCSELELWHHVATHLEAHGIGVVLVGGAVVAIYTDGAYRSGDLDFVPEDLFGDRVEACMAEIGFRRHGRHFEHPDCRHLFVEFVAGPLGIGDDVNIVPREEPLRGQVLKILSPTDCVRDRLASYIHFDARECLDQAVLVARAQIVDWDTIERWCLDEGARSGFEDLRRLVAARLERSPDAEGR
jgi:hypothetical protein